MPPLIGVVTQAFLFCVLQNAQGATPPESTPPPKMRSAMPRMSCERPTWPREALKRELQGTVTMKFLIDATGKVLDKGIVKSSGHEILDLAALEATARCILEVRASDGPAKEEWVQLQYVWTLE